MRRYLFKDSKENNVPISNAQLKKLLRKQCDMIIKEKDLMRNEQKLAKLINDTDKRPRSSLKRDLETVDEFKQARKKLIEAVEMKEKLEKLQKKRKNDKKRKKRRAKSKKRVSSTMRLNILHKFFDNYFKMDDKIKKIKAIKSKDFLASLTTIVLRPVYTRQLMDSSKYVRRYSETGPDCFLMSLRKTPQVWIYNRWPKLYSPYLDLRSQCKNCHFLCMSLLGFLFWIPCFIFIEICKCFLCCCCHDC